MNDFRENQGNRRPTLEEIRNWPATVDVADAALALGIGQSTVYKELSAEAGQIKAIRIGGRLKVLTSSLLALLDA